MKRMGIDEFQLFLGSPLIYAVIDGVRVFQITMRNDT